MTPPFETSTKPWFGPRSRAKIFLKKRQRVDLPAEAARKFGAFFGNRASKIQKVRFVDFFHRGEDDFRYSIAVVWTDSDPSFRQAVYESAESLVAETGWYPLPQGERMGSRLILKDVASEWHDLPRTMPFGASRICGFESAATEGNGTAIRVITDGSSILLDSALPGEIRLASSDRLLLLSHSHRDHTGNLDQCLSAGLLAVTSTGTLGILDSFGFIPPAATRRNLMRIQTGATTQLGGLTLTAFAVPHSPGSIGYLIEDQNHALIFPGDMSLRTGRHNFLPDLERLIPTRKKTTLFLDATMAGRSFGASASQPAGGVLDALRKQKRVFVISSDAEQLLYAYTDLFQRVKNCEDLRHQVAFVCPERLRHIFELLHASYIKRDAATLDPFIHQQYKATFSSWAESRSLYWFERLPSLDTETEKTIWLLTPRECQALNTLDGSSFPVGRLATGDNLVSLVGTISPLDTGAWTLHSSESELLNAATLSTKAKIVLFHNYTSRLRKFIKAHNFPAEVLQRTCFVNGVCS